jgi:hypothetical protein
MGSDPELHLGAKGEATGAEAERRAHPRFPFPSCAACRARTLAGSDCGPAWGLDVSLGGMAVRLLEEPAAGQVLVVELWRTDGGLSLTRFLCVAYAVLMFGGGYRVGGPFLQPLAPGELEQFLQCPSEPGHTD